MLVHKSAILALPLLLVLLAITPSADAGCTYSTQGDIKVATGSHSPPLMNHRSMGGITVSFEDQISPGKGFELRPTPGTAVSVVDGRYVPDFDVAWYTSSDGYIDKNYRDGPDSGTVPSGADYALVWLVYGPDLGNSDGKFPGAGWELRMNC